MQPELKNSGTDLSLNGLEDLLDSNVPKDLIESTTSGETGEQDWTVEETARVLGLSKGAVIRRLEDGILPGYRVKRGYGSAWRVKPIWVQRNGAQSTTEAKQNSENRELATERGTADGDSLSSTATNGVESVNATEDLNASTTIDVNVTATLDFSPDKITTASRSVTDAEPIIGQETKTEYLEVYEADEETKDCAAVPLSTYKELIELRTKLELIDTHYQETRNKLETANYKIGYLEARLESSQEALRLLGGSAKTNWWQNFCQWFRSSK